MFLSRISDVMSKANKTKIAFYEHSYLWVDSRTEFMHYFLTYGRQLTQEELEALVCPWGSANFFKGAKKFYFFGLTGGDVLQSTSNT
jgi:hypothetical protein